VLAVTSRGLGSWGGSGKSALMEEVCPAHAGWIFYISAKMVLMQKIILE